MNMIKRRGQFLCTRSFRSLLTEMMNNLYVHACSKDDIRKEAETQAEKKALQNIQHQQMMSVQNTMLGGL